MRDHSSLPSSHYPTFFKSDLRVGESDAHPLAKALDNTFQSISHLSHQIGLSLTPALFYEEQQKQILQYYGMKLDTLSGAEVDSLFTVAPHLFQQRGTLSVLHTLSDLYFHGATIGRGRPYPIDHVGSGPLHLVLSDHSDTNFVLFVRLLTTHPSDRITEFVCNAMLFLPHHYSIIVAPPLQPQLQTNSLRLNPGLRALARRL